MLPLQGARAGTVSIPIDPGAKRPANDLVYQGQSIDQSQADDLLRRGVELWRLNPQESQLWRDARQAPSDEADQHFPAEGATVRFDSYLASTQGIFRSSIDVIDSAAASGAVTAGDVRPFTLSVSLSNSAALMRAALLRRIGYRLSNPKLYHSLTIVFADKAARDQFVDNLADRSLTSRSRWIKGALDDRPQVTLQGVVLEPGRINQQALHWGLMSQALEQDRRVLRSLVIPDVLVDFTEKVNTFAWDPSRVFNGNINFDYLFSDGFSDVAYDDIKWITARLAGLAREDFGTMVGLAGLPEDISALLVEKIICRRDALVKLLGLAPAYPLMGYVSDLNVGNISHGQLTQDNYTGYPEEFYRKPDQPPMRFSQLWRYALIEGISAGIGGLLDLVNTNLLTAQSSGSAVAAQQNAVSQGMAKYIIKTGSLTGFQQTAGIWSMPLAGANINASRTVVAGTYLGSDSQVQLVDTLSVGVNGGFYLGWDGVSPIATPGLAATVTLLRSYSHVKPVQDMDAALRTNWGQMMAAGYMMHLSKALNPDVECSIPTGPWTSEFDVDGTRFIKINFDQNRPNGREEALDMRALLVAQGANPDRIVLEAIDRDSDCKADVEKAVDKNLADFADGMAVGDTFIITDSVQFGANESVNVPITVLAGFFDVAVAPSANQDYMIQRQTLIKKTATGFQVYLQDSKLETLNVGLDFNFWVNVFNVTRERRHGHASTDYYNIVTDGADVTTKQKLIRSLKALLRGNNAEILTDSFEPYTLKQDLLARLSKLKFLLWSLVNETQNLRVDILPPVDPHGNRNRGDFKRTLSMNRMVTQQGRDWFGFLMGSLSGATGGYVAMPGVGSGTDPGNSPGGKSWTGSISTQAEITPGTAFKPVTAVQQTFRGWLISRKDVFKIFDRIETAYGPILTTRAPYARGLFDRTLFSNTSQLELYQIDTTLMLYPEALHKVRDRVFSRDPGVLHDWLLDLSGNRRQTAWVSSILRMRSHGLPPDSDPQAQLQWYNSVMSYLVNNADPHRLLAQFEPQHYFFVTRVNGFRKNDATGVLDGYLSDTIGHYDSERGMGIFRDFSSQYGVSLFELYAQFFTDGL